jgi:general secretion pathway protein F
MPIYEYTALSESGQSKSGILDADTPRAARDKLRKDKVHVTSIRLAGDLTGSATAKKDGSGGAARLGRTLFRRRVRISTQDLSTFTRQLHAAQVGHADDESMRVLIEQTSGRRFEAIARRVRARDRRRAARRRAGQPPVGLQPALHQHGARGRGVGPPRRRAGAHR